MLKSFKYLSAAAMALLLSTAAAYAQPVANTDSGNVQAPAVQQTEMSAEKIQQFSEAQKSIVEIQNKYQSQAQNLTEQNDLAALQQQMDAEIQSSVQAHGLTVQEYAQISSAIRTNPEMAKEYQKTLQ